MREHIYDLGSWWNICKEAKKALEIKDLTQSQCKRMMQMYLTGAGIEDIITEMKGEEK